MGALDSLTFAKKAPVRAKAGGASPLEKARKKLLTDLEHQISLARDPNFEIITTNRAGEEKRRKPKSWVHSIEGDTAFLTIRYSNKAMPIGGKAGSFIKVAVGEVATALATVRDAVNAHELDGMIETMMAKAKRKPRNVIGGGGSNSYTVSQAGEVTKL